MKELKFEIPIPAFFDASGNKKKARVIISVVFVLVAAYLAREYALTFLETVVLAYFGLSLIWRLTSRLSAAVALGILICEPFLLYFKKDTLAETMAVYAFYFLVITVAQEALELRRVEPSTRRSPTKRTVDNFSRHPGKKIV